MTGVGYIQGFSDTDHDLFLNLSGGYAGVLTLWKCFECIIMSEQVSEQVS